MSAQALPPALAQRLLAEFVGTLLLVCTVVGSGIMAQHLADGNVALMLLANTVATVFILFVLIQTLGPISGAHFNPVVTAVFGAASGLPWSARMAYVGAQLAGAVAGVVLANLMFGHAPLELAQKVRSGPPLWLAEVLATAGLVFVIGRSVAHTAPALVAAYIGAAMWFTASTSLANPAATFGRMFSDSFAGVAPASFPALVAAQVAGGLLGALLLQALRTPKPVSAGQAGAEPAAQGSAPSQAPLARSEQARP
ncbi:aquaporin [Serpentinimonas barnesii]|uniref:aquaporin n=1 Tax=Serpentinimonas barnesii TaxID=1458427 RepID=UPI0009715CF3|nr:MIP/aquaporin family protein [Serpentinimonas barnesii]